MLAAFQPLGTVVGTHTGLAVARSRGRKGGRKPLSADDPKILLTKMHYLEGTKSIAAICELLSISPPTVYRRLRAAGVEIGVKGNVPRGRAPARG